MAKQKTKKEFIYHGLGFPVVLKNVPMIELRGVWTPDVDLNVLQKVALLALAHHSADLTGNQIRYIRLWLALSQMEFGKLLGVTHPAVVKWEKSGNMVSKITITTQRDLRLLLLDKLLKRDDDFRKSFRVLHATEFTKKTKLIKLDVPIDLVAI